MKVPSFFSMGYPKTHKKTSMTKIQGAFWRMLKDDVREVKFSQVTQSYGKDFDIL
jgi:hypothetical protein